MFFRKRQPLCRGTAPKAKVAARTAIAPVFRKGHQLLATFLGKKFNALPVKTRKIFLLLFCLLFGSACSWFLVRTVWLPPPSLPVPGIGSSPGAGAVLQDTLDRPPLKNK